MGASVPRRVDKEDELDPETRRDRPGLVELSREEPTRGSLFNDIRALCQCEPGQSVTADLG